LKHYSAIFYVADQNNFLLFRIFSERIYVRRC